MMPPYSAENERLWGLQCSPKYTSIIIFLPNGIMTLLSCSKDTTLETIKNDAWTAAKKDVLYRRLKDKSAYIFSGITWTGKHDEFYDESKRICELRLFHACLKLIEPKGDKAEKVLNSNISFAIGKALDEFENSNDSETNQFRTDIIHYIEEIVKVREKSSVDERLKYFYPPELDNYHLIKKREQSRVDQPNEEGDFQAVDFKQSVESSLQTILKSDHSTEIINHLTVCVWFIDAESKRLKHELKIESELKPDQLIKRCLTKFQADESQTYLLKVCGTDQYLLNDQPILRYKYVVECISREQIVQLCLVKYDEVASKIPKTNFILPTFLKKPVYMEKNHPKLYGQNPSLWTQTHKRLSVLIHSITYINITNIDKIYIKAGLYHGNELLCKPIDTSQVESKKLKWSERLVFDINMEDIPRNAKICLAVCATRKKTSIHFAIKWANLQVFDYYGRLISGRTELTLFPMPKGTHLLLIYQNIYKLIIILFIFLNDFNSVCSLIQYEN